MWKMKRLFDITLLLENLMEAIAIFAVIWLQGRAYHMTGPHEMATIGRVIVLVVLCSFSAFVLGVISLINLHILKKQAADRLVSRSLWAYASLLASIVVIMLSILPVRTG
jgi:hypothetical protein